jgi:DNA polymerase-4
MAILCRDCGYLEPEIVEGRCPSCASPRRIAHAELSELTIAHIDCDAFYAAVEKRDDPKLQGKPLIIGGGKRGVVATACYVARRFGVKSAMPMFKALSACPEAIVLRPNMEKYVAAGRQVRDILETTTPLVEPLSIDEAFLDLTGSKRLHGKPPAAVLVGIAKTIEKEVGVTVSIGLSYAKFLAKLASEIDKPRGFAVIGRSEAKEFLAKLPVSSLPGVGAKFTAKLKKDGFKTIADLARLPTGKLQKEYGATGARLEDFCNGRDPRSVNPSRTTKSISSEITLETDLRDADDLKPLLWRQAERVSQRLKEKGFSAGTVVLKLKTDTFQIITRQRPISPPTQLAERLYRAAEKLLQSELGQNHYRLIGISGTDLQPEQEADAADLIAKEELTRTTKLESAMSQIRAKAGDGAIYKGRAISLKSLNPKT